MKVQIKFFYETNKPDKAELKVSYDDGSALEMKGTEAIETAKEWLDKMTDEPIGNNNIIDNTVISTH